MSTQIQRRRGTTAQHSTFTGAVGEVTVDTDKEVLVVHDGAQAGGYPQMRENGSNSALALGSATTPSLKFSGDTNTGIYSPGADQVAISTNGTGRVFVDAAGSVGIGKTPSYALDVAGSIQITNAQAIRALNSTGTSYRLVTPGGDDNLYLGGNEANSNEAIVFRANDSERMRLDSSGRLGLGTSSPSSALDVAGAISLGAVALPSAGTARIFSRNTDSNLYIQTAGGNTAYLLDGSQNTLASFNSSAVSFNTGNTARLSIDSSGRVGIGTTSVNSKLAVSNGGAESFEFYPADASNVNKINYYNRSGAVYCDAVQNAASHQFAISGTEKARLDSSGRLLVGTSTARTTDGTANRTLQIEDTGNYGVSVIKNSNDTFGGILTLAKSRGTAIGSNTIVQPNDVLGQIQFLGADGGTLNSIGARINAEVDGTPGANDLPTRLVFSTCPDSSASPVERLRLSQNGEFISAGIYNFSTSNAANVYIFSSGELRRSTSSGKYKTNVETLEDAYSDALLSCRPVWYRSTCDKDNPDWGWWGFIAEEVAEIDPRLVHWKTSEVTYDENGSAVETPCDPEPEGVAYDRFVPHLLNLIKRQKEQIEAMEARLSALEAS